MEKELKRKMGSQEVRYNPVEHIYLSDGGKKGTRAVRIIKEAIWESGVMRISEVKMEESFQKSIGMVIEIVSKYCRSISL